MLIVAYLTKFYDWDPVPKNTVVTEQDIAAGKVMPDRNGGYRMKVVKVPLAPFPCTMGVSEGDLIEKIIEEKSDIRKAGRTLTRHQAVAHLIMDQILPNVGAEIGWIQRIELHDDGPSEELMRAKLEPHTKADHGRRPGRKNIPAEHVDDHVAQYLGQWTPLPSFAAADLEKPTEDDIKAHAIAARPIRDKNHADLVSFLHSYLGVKS